MRRPPRHCARMSLAIVAAATGSASRAATATRSRAAAAAAGERRGLRWAVSHPAGVVPFLLGPNAGGWANTTRSVAEARPPP